MPDRLPDALHDKLSRRLSYYEDIGIRLFYRDRSAISPDDADRRGTARLCPVLPEPTMQQEPDLEVATEGNPKTGTAVPTPQEGTLPRTSSKSFPKPVVPQAISVALAPSPKVTILPPMPKVSLFDAVSRIADDSLLKIRTDLGECTRCKLHTSRNKIVFGDGNPKAELVFVGEGPGRDEDAQGLPFVGRAGKLLTQMIEAMGLQRSDIYICNVVKCRPPENRLPEPDEIKTCSPFLLRQLDSIAPKVIVCLGACSAQTLLETNRGISQFRGQWLDFRGRKLMATYHPAYLLRNPAAKADVWKDLQKVMAVLGLELKKGKPAGVEKPS
jgi:uracil-DNA glycosylase family 4